MASKSKTKRNLYNLLSGLNFEIIAAVIMALIAAQPLFGILERVTAQNDLIALFYGKATVIRFIGICGLFVGLAYAWVRTKDHGSAFMKKKLLGNPWNLVFLIMLLWALITAAAAVNPQIAFFSYAYRYEGYLSYLAYAGVFLCGSMIRKDETRRRVIDFAIIIAVVVALLTLFSQAIESKYIMFRNGFVGAYSGTFINTNHYGYYLALVLMLCAGRFYHCEKILPKIFFAFAFFINIRVLLYNNSFGPYLAVSVGLLAYFIILCVRDGIKKSWVYLIIPVIFFGMGAIVDNGLMIRTYGTIFAEAVKVVKTMNGAKDAGKTVGEALADDKGAGSGRMEIWMAAIEVWKKRMVIGVGPENIPMEMKNQGYLETYEATHNTYLQVLAEMGIIGFIIYMTGHIWFFVRNIRRSKKMDSSALIAYGAAATFLVSAAFGITITVCEVFLYFALGLANGYHTEEAVGEMLPKL